MGITNVIVSYLLLHHPGFVYFLLYASHSHKPGKFVMS